MRTDPNGMFIVSGTIAVSYASYAVAGMIASGILYYGIPIAADIGQSIGNLLAENQRGNPSTGEPNTWVEHPHGKQDRYYGPDGNPLVDIDYGHDHGQGTPHAHNWKDGVRENGVPVSVIKESTVFNGKNDY